MGLLVRFRFGIVAPTLFAQSAKKSGAPQWEWVSKRQEQVGQPPLFLFNVISPDTASNQIL